MDNKSSFLTPLFLSGLLLTSSFSQAETEEQPNEATSEEVQEQNNIEQVEPYNRFVTERLYEFIHSGSSNRYRITGRAAAGEEVKVIARDTETGWLQIEQANGKQGWINNSVLVTNSGSRAQLETANAKIAELEEQLKLAKQENGSDEIIAQLNSEVGNLTLANEDLGREIDDLKTQNAEVDQLRARNLELEESIVQADQTQKILDKLYDVGAVLLGVFAGWLLTRRRKSSLSFDRL